MHFALVSLSCISLLACERMHIYMCCWHWRGSYECKGQTTIFTCNSLRRVKEDWTTEGEVLWCPQRQTGFILNGKYMTLSILCCSILSRPVAGETEQSMCCLSMKGNKRLWSFRISSLWGNRCWQCCEQLTSTLLPMQLLWHCKGEKQRGGGICHSFFWVTTVSSAYGYQNLKPISCFVAERV